MGVQGKVEEGGRVKGKRGEGGRGEGGKEGKAEIGMNRVQVTLTRA